MPVATRLHAFTKMQSHTWETQTHTSANPMEETRQDLTSKRTATS